MNGQPSVSIVLVNWNSLDDTLECLSSLALVAYGNFSVVVIDNGSLQDEAKVIQGAFPSITLLKTERNLGFTGGHNLGIQHALKVGADYILCLNTDTIVAPDFLDHMVEAAEADPKVGIVTSAIYSYSQPNILIGLGCWLSLGETPPAGHIVNVEASQEDGVVEVDFAEGCVLMMKNSVAQQLAGFDDKFFAYSEDADFCLRARALGWRCVVVPRAQIWHKAEAKEGGATGQNSAGSIYYSRRNWYRLVRRHSTKAQLQSFMTAERKLFLSAWKSYLKESVSGRTTSCRSSGRSHILDYTLSVLAGRLGCYGSRSKWRNLEITFSLIITTLMWMVVGLGRIVYMGRQATRALR